MKNILPNLWKLIPKSGLTILALLIITANSSHAQDITTDLVAKWSFSQSADDDDGVFGTAAVVGATLTTDRLGRVDSAYSFDGVNDYIQITDAPSLNFVSGESFTFALWFRCDPHTVNRIFVSKGSGSPSFTLRMQADGTLESFVRTSTSQDTRFTTPIRYDDGEWHHAAFTITVGVSSAIYVDGEEAASLVLSRTGDLNTGADMRFGTFSLSEQQLMKGDLDDIHLYSRILTKDDINALYNIEPLPFLAIESTTPSAGSFSALPNSIIEIKGDRPIDPAASVQVRGSLSGYTSGTSNVVDSTFTFDPAIDFIRGETVTVSFDDTFKAANGDTLKVRESLQFTVASNLSPEYPNTVFASDSTIDNFVNGNANIVFGDMDEDGDMDAVGISPGESKVTLYVNDGTGVFDTQINIATNANSSTDVQLGDANNNGLLDVFVSYNSKIVWYENLGSSAFSTENVIATGVANRDLVIVDLDVDGALDIVNYTYFATSASIIYGNGDGTFESNAVLAGSTGQGGIQHITAGAINAGDDLPDVLLTNAGLTIPYLVNQGNRTYSVSYLPAFPNPNPGNLPQGVGNSGAIADLNGDGLNDVIVGTYDASGTEGNPSLIGYFQNNANGSFSSFSSIATLGTSGRFGAINIQEVNVNAADLDGDADPDLIVYALEGKLSWIENEGNGVYSERKEIGNYTPGISRVNTPKAVDLTGDGVLDIAALADGQFRYFANEDILSVVSITPTNNAIDIAWDADIVVTFDKDVDESTLTTNNVIVTGSKSGNLTGSVTSSYNDKVLTIDFANDLEESEIITLTLRNLASTDGLDFLEYTSKFTTFSRRVVSTFPKQGQLLTVDSISLTFNTAIDPSDLTSSNIQIISSQYGALDGMFSLEEDSIVVFKPSTLFRSGDIIQVSSQLGQFHTYELIIGSETGTNPVTFAESLLYTGGTQSSSILALADSDSDDDLDILFSDYNSGNVNWLQNSNGFGGFSSIVPVDAISNSNSYAIAAADLDRDGKIEYIIADNNVGSNSGNMVVLSYNESTSQWDKTIILDTEQLNETSQISSIQVVDIDQDGQEELFTVAHDGVRPYFSIYQLQADFSLSSFSSFRLEGLGFLLSTKVIDIDNDGAFEVIYTSSSGVFYYNLEQVLDIDNFDVIADQTQLLTGEFYDPQFGDIDADGDLDIMLGAGAAGVKLLINNGDVTFSSLDITLNSDEAFVYNLTLGDVNGDDNMDIIYSDIRDGGYVGYLQHDGSFSFTDIVITQSAQTNRDVAVGDVDKDGDLDIFGLNNGRVALFKNLTIDNNLPPAIVNPITTLTLDEDSADSLIVSDLNMVFSDPESDAITYTVVSDTSAVTVTIVNDTTVNLNLAANYHGVSQVTITATDTNGGATDMVVAVTVTSVNDQPIVANPITEFSLNEDQGQDAINLANMFSDVEDEMLTYSFTNTNGAIDVSLDEPNQRLVLDLIADANGDGVLTVLATDSENAIATNEIQLSVAAVNDAPVLSVNDIMVDEDFATQQTSVVSITQPANEADQTVTVSVSPDPSTTDWAVIAFDETTATFTVDAVANSFGSQVFTIIVDDGQSVNNTTSVDITIAVSAVNDAPNFELSTNQLTLGQDFAGTETITLTDLSPANETELINYSLSPASVAFVNVDIDATSGEISLTAILGEAGSQVFTITADDGSATASDQLTIEILSNQAPVIVNTIMDMTYGEDAGLQVVVSDFTVLFSDPDGDDLSYTVASDNADIQVGLVGNTIEMVASADYFGSGKITFTASDATLATDLVFNVEITAVNDAPFVANAVADQVSLEDANFSYQLPANVFDDVDGGNLELIVSGVPTWMNFDGLSRFFTASPTNDEVGVYTISLEATDGTLSATDEFTITIENVNDAPTVTNTIADQTLEEDAAPISLDLSTFFEDVDGDVLTYTLENSTLDAALVTVDNGTLAITPFIDANGAGSIEISATDGDLSASQTFNVTITEVNDAPTFTLSETAISVEANFTTQIISVTPDLVPSDETDQSVVYSLSPAALDFATLTIDAITGEVTIASIADESGQATVTVVADDGRSENNTFEASFDLTVARVLSVNDHLSEGIKIYPNPVAEYIMIDTNELVDLRFYGLDGQLIKEYVQVNGKVDVSNLQTGTYLMQVSNSEEQITLKINKAN